MVSRYYSFIIRYRWLIIILVIIITVFFLYQFPKLRWETDANAYLPKGHPAIKYDEVVDKIFGVKDAIIIGIVNEKKGIFNPETLNMISRLTNKFLQLDGVDAPRRTDVASLATSIIFWADRDSMGSYPLMPKQIKDQKDVMGIKEDVYKNPDLFLGNIVSDDGMATMIRVKLKEGIYNRYKVYYQIEGLLLEEVYASDRGQGSEGISGEVAGNWDWKTGSRYKPNKAKDNSNYNLTTKNGDVFYIAGRPVIEVTSGIYAKKDIQKMVPLIILMIILVLLLIFRNIRGVLLPLLVVSLSIIWTFGMMAVFNVPIYTVSTMVPVILMSVGIAYAIYILSRYDDIIKHSDTEIYFKDRILIQACSEVHTSILMASFTTIAGFLSLVFASMVPFRFFGIFSAIGVLVAVVLTITFIPAVLYILPIRQRKVNKADTKVKESLIENALLWYATYLSKHPPLVLAVMIIAILLSVKGLHSLYIDSSWIGDFKKESEVYRANEMLKEKFDGTVFLNIIIEGEKIDTIKDVNLLKKIDALQGYVEGLDFVGGSTSIVDYIKNLHYMMNGRDERYKSVPPTKDIISEYLYLFVMSKNPFVLDEVVDYLYKKTNIRVALKTDSTREIEIIIDKVKAYIEKNLNMHGIQVNFAGSANNSHAWVEMLIKNTASGIIFSKVAVFTLTLLMFRSFIGGIINIIPISMAILYVFGAMGYIGAPLDASNTLASGIGIGIGIDYTIHYIHQYRKEFIQHGVFLDSTILTMKKIGKPIFYNALAVALGFLVLHFSIFPPNMKLGYFVASYMLSSFIAAVLILPLIFYYITPAFIKRNYV